MESVRLPRFKRTAEVAAFQLTERDQHILRLVYRYRFLRSSQIVLLIGSSAQQISRRLKLLYHHGYLERPRAQIDYYHKGGSRQIVHGLGNKGEALLRSAPGLALHIIKWGAKNRSIGRLFLEHALLVSDVMVKIELACRERGDVRLLTEEELCASDPICDLGAQFKWSVRVNSRLKFGVIPDRVFALEFADKPDDRMFFFLEADRGTMPVTRKNLSKTSFHRKLLAYEATWTQNLHRTLFGFHRVRVLTVTTSAGRARHLTKVAAILERGRGLFLFCDAQSLLAHSPLAAIWKSGASGESTSLLA